MSIKNISSEIELLRKANAELRKKNERLKQEITGLHAENVMLRHDVVKARELASLIKHFATEEEE